MVYISVINTQTLQWNVTPLLGHFWGRAGFYGLYFSHHYTHIAHYKSCWTLYLPWTQNYTSTCPQPSVTINCLTHLSDFYLEILEVNREAYKILETKLRHLIHILTTKKLRHASGPVQASARYINNPGLNWNMQNTALQPKFCANFKIVFGNQKLKFFQVWKNKNLNLYPAVVAWR